VGISLESHCLTVFLEVAEHRAIDRPSTAGLSEVDLAGRPCRLTSGRPQRGILSLRQGPEAELAEQRARDHSPENLQTHSNEPTEFQTISRDRWNAAEVP
jgi:hypothetical protein